MCKYEHNMLFTAVSHYSVQHNSNLVLEDILNNSNSILLNAYISNEANTGYQVGSSQFEYIFHPSFFYCSSRSKKRPEEDSD